MIHTSKITWQYFNILLFGVLLSAFLLSAKASGAAPSNVRVAVEGVLLEMPVPPAIVEDRTLVGVRFVGEAVGGKVDWDQEKLQATIMRHSDTVVLTLGNREAVVNGKIVLMEVPAQLVQERTMVPLRFIAEALGGATEWNPETRTANVLRKPTQITNMSYRRDIGKTTLTLTLSEPLMRLDPVVNNNDLSIGLYPAEIKTSQTGMLPYDALIRGVQLVPEGRTVSLQAFMWGAPVYRQTLSADGTQLVYEFEYSIQGVQAQPDGRIPVVNIAANGRLNYTTLELQNPARLVIDVTGARMGSEMPASLDTTGPLVKRVRSALFSRNPDTVRIVLDLEKPHPYQITSTDLGLQVRFIPEIQLVKTEKLAGKSRLTFAASLPIEPRITLTAGKPEIRIEVPQAISGLKENLVRVADGTIESIQVVPSANKNSSLVIISLPYYLSHTVLSKPGEDAITIDLVTSPIYGKRIWVDAGHGKIPGGRDDPGSIGLNWRLTEKEINLAVSLELQRRLQEAGAIVLMTRTGDEGINFVDRPILVNRQQPSVDLFLSVHHNSALNRVARGVETFYWINHPKSKVVAEALHPAIVRALGFPDRKVRQESYKVLADVKAPAVLLELGYLSNADEERAITEPGARQKTYHMKAVDGIIAGIFTYYWQELRSASPTSR